jgi:hypothetical protein
VAKGVFSGVASMAASGGESSPLQPPNQTIVRTEQYFLKEVTVTDLCQSKNILS